MKCETDFSATPCLVTISGEVDMTCAPQLAQLEKELAGHGGVVVDVRNLRYTDTTFLRFLLRLQKGANASQACAVTLLGANHALQRVLEITGLRPMFDLRACGA